MQSCAHRLNSNTCIRSLHAPVKTEAYQLCKKCVIYHRYVEPYSAHQEEDDDELGVSIGHLGFRRYRFMFKRVLRMSDPVVLLRVFVGSGLQICVGSVAI
jgi:hypothetical protein